MGKQTIQEIAKILVEKNKLTPKEANQFAATMFEIIQQQLDSEGLVKIKGLGTFKMIRVEARESVSVRTGERVMIDSHAKITFMPDAAMKELVNKPFSQFETVVLNDGVEFEDLPEDEPEEDNSNEESVMLSTIVESPTVEEAVVPVVEEKPVVPSPTEVIDDTVEEGDTMAVDTENESTTIDDAEKFTFQDDDKDTGSWKKVLGYGFLTLVLMAVSAYGGFWYGQRTATPMVEVAVEDKMNPEILITDSIEVVDVDTTEVAVESPAMEQSPSEIKEEKVPEEEPFWKKYEAMDVRVRTGAYHIIGTDHEVKVKKGETLSRIARRELGEGMSCYIEVYNNLNIDSELQEGQIIKIPKLKWKLKR